MYFRIYNLDCCRTQFQGVAHKAFDNFLGSSFLGKSVYLRKSVLRNRIAAWHCHIHHTLAREMAAYGCLLLGSEMDKRICPLRSPSCAVRPRCHSGAEGDRIHTLAREIKTPCNTAAKAGFHLPEKHFSRKSIFSFDKCSSIFDKGVYLRCYGWAAPVKYPGPFFVEKVYIYECPICATGLLLDIAIYTIFSQERFRPSLLDQFVFALVVPEKHFSRKIFSFDNCSFIFNKGVNLLC